MVLGSVGCDDDKETTSAIILKILKEFLNVYITARED